MIHPAGNRRTRRVAQTYLDHPAYLWAIESDWPQHRAKLLAYHYAYDMPNIIVENRMGERLTFTKFGVKIWQVTDRAILFDFKGMEAAPSIWLARSNMRSDDDKRMKEIKQQLESRNAVGTEIHIVDWLVRKEGWAVA